MLNVVLYEPEIPHNTGAAIRLCANSGFRLHLVRPLGFDLDHRKLRRAGLDYHEFADLQVHESWGEFLNQVPGGTVYACTTHGSQRHDQCRFKPGDSLLFGPETRGIPVELRQQFPPGQLVRIPMLQHSRSINLANAVAIVMYEAWRQLDFEGAI